LGLGDLRLWSHAAGQQMGLPQLQRIRDDLESVIQHTARVSMVVRLRGRQLLYQLGVALERPLVKRGELLVRKRRPLPDMLQQVLSPRRRQESAGRLRQEQLPTKRRIDSAIERGSRLA